MVAAMNRGVAVQTGAQQKLLCRGGTARRRRESSAAEGRCGVKTSGVTALAQPRRAHLQQRHNVRSVCHMAVAAVVRRGRVLPEEWAALFGVTAVAGLVDGILDQ